MIIYFRELYDNNFLDEFLPRVIVNRIYQQITNSNTIRMNDYLKSIFHVDVTVQDIIEQMMFSHNKLGNGCKFYVNPNIYEEKTQQKLISLLKLIDYGALGIRGLDIIVPTFKYVQENIAEIYYTYKLMGGNYGN